MPATLTPADIDRQPDQFTTTITTNRGEVVEIRPLRASDTELLGDYFLSLSAATRMRYAPHAFDRATAAQLCAAGNGGNACRLVGIATTPTGPRLVAYFIIFLTTRGYDGTRYAARGTPLTDDVCALAPSVADDWQEHGLGSRLMPHVLTVLRRLGRSRLILAGGVQADNHRAVHFYRKSGFHPVGEFSSQRQGETINNYDMVLDVPAPGGAGAL